MVATIIIGLLALFFSFLYDRRVGNWGFIVSMILITVFCAIRYEWGTDMPQYAESFDQYGLEGVRFWQLDKITHINLRASESYEYGWSILNILCQPIGFFGMTILLSVFEGIVVYWFIKRYVPRGYYTFAVFLYIFNTNLMVLGCSMMRQWLAMCIVLIAFGYLEKGKLWLSIFFIFFASLFHSSALFCLVFPLFNLLRNVTIDSRNVLMFSIAVLAWVYLFGRFLGSGISQIFSISRFEQYEEYMLSSRETATVGWGALMNVIVVILCIFSLGNASKDIKSLTWINAGYLVVLPLVTLLPLASRVLFYYELMSIAVIPNGIKNAWSSKKALASWFIVLWILFWYIFMFIRFFNGYPWKLSYMDYSTIFDAPFWR